MYFLSASYAADVHLRVKLSMSTYLITQTELNETPFCCCHLVRDGHNKTNGKFCHFSLGHDKGKACPYPQVGYKAQYVTV